MSDHPFQPSAHVPISCAVCGQEQRFHHDDLLTTVKKALANATPGPWTACRMTHHEREDDLTPEEIGEYVRNSVVKSTQESGSGAFLFVSAEKLGGPADVCHVGNGPTSPQNAHLIANAPDWLRVLVTSREQAEVEQNAVTLKAHDHGYEHGRLAAFGVIRKAAQTVIDQRKPRAFEPHDDGRRSFAFDVLELCDDALGARREP